MTSNWTETPPTEPGFYWARLSFPHGVTRKEIVRVFEWPRASGARRFRRTVGMMCSCSMESCLEWWPVPEVAPRDDVADDDDAEDDDYESTKPYADLDIDLTDDEDDN